jgi:hypothetical protein
MAECWTVGFAKGKTKDNRDGRWLDVGMVSWYGTILWSGYGLMDWLAGKMRAATRYLQQKRAPIQPSM